MLHRVPSLRESLLLIAAATVLSLVWPASPGVAGTSLKETMRFAAEMARSGSWREAKFRWRDAARQDPANPRVLNNLAVASEALGEWEAARDYYDQALGLHPDNVFIQDNQKRFARFWRQLRERLGEPVEQASDRPAREATMAAGNGKQSTRKKGKAERVGVALPVPPRLELNGDEKVLVASFLVDETDLLNINRELVRFLRVEFRKRTGLEVLDVVPPPAVPEQRVEDLIENKEFWKYLHREFGADLIVSGTLTYDREDASGWENVDRVSPSTGQKVRRQEFVEREQFTYTLEIFFIDGATGELRHRERLHRGAVFRGTQNDPITAFYELSETIAQDVLSVVTSRSRNDTRSIFKI